MSSVTVGIAPEMEALKTRLKATWESGDYGQFAEYMLNGAIEFFDRLDIPPGTKLLDIGCGAGQLTLPAAQRGIDVIGVDLASNLVFEARERARRLGLEIDVRQGDAESLSFEDGEFDVAMSFIGSMFAPRPELVASEMLRVVKPGGRILMGNWTPAGHVGQMFKIIGKHVPPPPIFPSPLMWGDPDKVRERFGDGLSELKITPRMFPFRYPFGPAGVTEVFMKFYGPTVTALGALDEAGKAAPIADFTALWETNNHATDGTTAVEGEYIEVEGIRA